MSEIAVIGAGAWGTALSMVLGRARDASVSASGLTKKK
jgi:glycerol-3-phosphate dehydrogenase